MDQNSIEVRRFYAVNDEELQHELNQIVSQGFDIVSTHPEHDDWWKAVVKRNDVLQKGV